MFKRFSPAPADAGLKQGLWLERCPPISPRTLTLHPSQLTWGDSGLQRSSRLGRELAASLSPLAKPVTNTPSQSSVTSAAATKMRPRLVILDQSTVAVSQIEEQRKAEPDDFRLNHRILSEIRSSGGFARVVCTTARPAALLIVAPGGRRSLSTTSRWWIPPQEGTNR